MSTFTVQQIETICVPVEHPGVSRISEIIVNSRITSPVNAAKAAKNHRMIVEKKEAIKQRTLERDANKVQKTDKVTKSKVKKVIKPMTLVSKDAAKQAKVRRKNIRIAKKHHTDFRKNIKTTRNRLNLKWKEEAKELKHRMIVEKKEAIKQRKLERDIKKAQKIVKVTKPKAKKVIKPMTLISKDAAKQAKVRRKSILIAKKQHTDFKKIMKTTRSQLTLKWKEEVKQARILKKIAREKAKKENKTVKKITDASKPLTPKKSKLTAMEKMTNKANRSHSNEMRRREKWDRQFQVKFDGVSFQSSRISSFDK